jgi:hypothetical protein
LVLALGYLSKAIFFPLGLIFVLCFYFLVRHRPRGTLAAAVLFLLFIGLSSIQWLPLSLSKHRFTFGDTGKINYVTSVSLGGAEDWLAMQKSLDGTPLQHPVRVVPAALKMVEFKGPIATTYPLSYDPSYWMEGLHLTVRPLRQLAVLIGNTQQLLLALAGARLGMGLASGLIGLLALVFLMRQGRELFSRLSWELFIPPLAGLGAYGITLILYRYVMGFLAVILIVLFADILAHFDDHRARAAKAVALALFVTTFGVLLGQSLGELRVQVRHTSLHQLLDDPNADAALALHQLNVGEGTPVAEIGSMEASYFPELAGVRFVSRVEDAAAFWNLSEPEKEKIYQAFASTGARAIITPAPPSHFSVEGWTPIGDSGCLLHPL